MVLIIFQAWLRQWLYKDTYLAGMGELPDLFHNPEDAVVQQLGRFDAIVFMDPSLISVI